MAENLFLAHSYSSPLAFWPLIYGEEAQPSL